MSTSMHAIVLSLASVLLNPRATVVVKRESLDLDDDGPEEVEVTVEVHPVGDDTHVAVFGLDDEGNLWGSREAQEQGVELMVLTFIQEPFSARIPKKATPSSPVAEPVCALAFPV